MSYPFSQKIFLSSSLLILSLFLFSPEAKGMDVLEEQSVKARKGPIRLKAKESFFLTNEGSPQKNVNWQAIGKELAVQRPDDSTLGLRLQAIATNQDVFFDRSHLFFYLDEKDPIKFTNFLLEGEPEQLTAWANVLKEINPILSTKWKGLGLDEKTERLISRTFIEGLHELTTLGFLKEHMFSLSENQIHGVGKNIVKIIKYIDVSKYLTKDKEKIKLKQDLSLMAKFLKIGALLRQAITENATKGNHQAMFLRGISHGNGNLLIKKNPKKMMKWLTEAAARGNIRSMKSLGDIYRTGREGIEKNPKEAVNWYEQGVEHGDVHSMHQLACMYRDGDEIGKDFDKALELFMKAAEKDDGFSMSQIAGMYMGIEGVEKDPKKAVKWYEKGVENGDVLSMHQLAEMYLSGQDVEQDPKKALKLLIQSAEKIHWPFFLENPAFQENAEIPIRSLKYTNTKIAERLGDLFRTGEEGIEKDLHKALEWYTEGAENGGAQSMAWLTYMYLGNEGIERDLKEVMKWGEKGAEAGHGYCMWTLGGLYSTGEGVKKSPKKAIEWYKKGAEKGRTACMKALGDMYGKGEEIKKKPYKSLKWYKKGAKLGDGNCTEALGDLYRTGEGDVKKDPHKALKWYKIGAEKDNTYCMSWLTCMYRGNQGIEADLKEAAEWAGKGAEKGSEYCINALKEMSSDDIQKPSVVIEGKGEPIQFDLQPTGGNRTGRATDMAQKIEREGHQIKVTTDNNASASYQLESETFPVNPGETIHVHYNITVEEGGIIALGLLDTSICSWYGPEVLLKAGHHKDFFERIVPSGESKASLVVRNYHLGTPGQSTFTIEEIGLYKK